MKRNIAANFNAIYVAQIDAMRMMKVKSAAVDFYVKIASIVCKAEANRLTRHHIMIMVALFAS